MVQFSLPIPRSSCTYERVYQSIICYRIFTTLILSKAALNPVAVAAEALLMSHRCALPEPLLPNRSFKVDGAVPVPFLVKNIESGMVTVCQPVVLKLKLFPSLSFQGS